MMQTQEFIETIQDRSFVATPELIEYLWEADEGDLEILFARARELRHELCGDKIFPYGFVYFSTYCRNHCNFCYFRATNDIERYRKSPEDTLRYAKALVESGVVLIDLTMGEDPVYHSEDFATLIHIVRQLKEDTGISVMVSPGVVPMHVLAELKNADADILALYQETHNKELFKTLRGDQDYDERMFAKLEASRLGMRIEEGLLSGVGESAADVAHSLQEMGRIGASQIRVMSFVPQDGSPMEHIRSGERRRELITIALMRIQYPHVLIPASLDVDGITGLASRLNAGANVVTSIIPPHSGLMGVAHKELEVDSGGRTVAELRPIIESLGLGLATSADFKEFLCKV